MSTVLVWVMISVGGSGSNEFVYSPPAVDLASCQRMQAVAQKLRRRIETQCVEIKMYKDHH